LHFAKVSRESGALELAGCCNPWQGTALLLSQLQGYDAASFGKACMETIGYHFCQQKTYSIPSKGQTGVVKRIRISEAAAYDVCKD
jgi:hypothetical protein